jgi:hypothetical protein
LQNKEENGILWEMRILLPFLEGKSAPGERREKDDNNGCRTGEKLPAGLFSGAVVLQLPV